jgi:hypothetical protein
MGNIKFKIFPVTPLRFDILEIESKKKKISCGRRAVQGALSFLWKCAMGKYEARLSTKSCQGGKSDRFAASDCEDGKYKV